MLLPIFYAIAIAIPKEDYVYIKNFFPHWAFGLLRPVAFRSDKRKKEL